MPAGAWREFAAFSGPEMPTLTAWSNRVVLVGDSSHALSGAFGSGAGFAMEDGWVLAQALTYHSNDTDRALALFNEIRLPYYARMYQFLASEGLRRAKILDKSGDLPYDERVKGRVITGGGMDWIYEHDVEAAWRAAVGDERADKEKTGNGQSSTQLASL